MLPPFASVTAVSEGMNLLCAPEEPWKVDVFATWRSAIPPQLPGMKGGRTPYRAKLLSMGLTKGTEFKVLQFAPLGDPVEIEVRGFSLSLRREEADALILKEGVGA